jgi:hypothetical protein
MLPLSCTNCCHNPLQSDGIGTSFGYCTEHRVILREPWSLTCGRLLRRDLSIVRSEVVRTSHAANYSRFDVAFLRPNGATPREAGFVDDDSESITPDPVSESVLDYGELGTKIESLAQLRQIEGARAEIALLSLSRAYANRCFARDAKWTSSIHLLWWTRRRLSSMPSISANDLACELPISIKRQIEIATWSVLMLRLLFISDVGEYARPSRARVARLRTLAEDAAMATSTIVPDKLLRWIRRTGLKRFDDAFPEEVYRRLASELHREPDD